MATVKLKFRASTQDGKEGRLYYQIIQKRMIRQINTTYKVSAKEWDNSNSRLIIPEVKNTRRNYLEDIENRIKLDLNRILQIISSFDRKNKEYTADDIVNTFNKRLREITLFDFMQNIISRLVELRKYRTSETYKTTLNSFMKFRSGEDLLLSDISADMIIDYEAHLINKGLTMNTVSFYMRILRAVYNRAIEKEIIEYSNPFKKVYTGVDKTMKRALSITDIKIIKELNLSPDIIIRQRTARTVM